MLEIYLLLWLTKTVQNESQHFQCATHNAVTLFYRLIGRYKSELSH
jgi:hypothetical protein